MQSKKKIAPNNIPVYEISGKHTSRGCEALFYRMGRARYGLKLYRNFQLAYDSYNRQILAAKHGLGPEVGKFIMARKKGRKTILFGYETQKIEEYDHDNYNHVKIFNKQSGRLYEKLRKLGLAGDFGDVNCGILNGILLAVDFGSHSNSDW
jgi:hypothetical protein